MKYGPEYRKTKTGLEIMLKSADENEAQTEIDYLKRACGETPFLLSEPEDINFTVEGEREFLKKYAEDPRALMLNVYVGGVLAGNSSFAPVSTAKRLCHRASLGIAVFLEFCNQGIGEVMISALLEEAEKCGFEIMELDVFAKNERGIHLYEKLGFKECGRTKNAVKYKDGTYDDEIKMQKFL